MPPTTEEKKTANQTVTEPEKESIEEPQEKPREEPSEITQPPVAVEAPVTFPEPVPEASPKSQYSPLSQIVVPVVVTKPVETTGPATVSQNTLDVPLEWGTSSSKQSPSASEDVRFGSDVAPRFLHREIPIYPLLARRLGKEGKVLLRLTIDEKGNLLSMDVIEKGGYGFTEAAMEAVKKSTFLPAKKDGKPIASRALLPVRFRLERN
jgi:protein TonB